MKKRALVSVMLFFDVILLAVTGLVAVFDQFIGEKAEFIVKLIHFITGLLFIILAVYHVIYNWKALKSYIKRKK
jgi:threonine/homoserine/homoserine lactone efflux protein